MRILNKLTSMFRALGTKISTKLITVVDVLGTKGEQMTDKIIGIAVALLVAAVVLPIGIDQLVGLDTSAWPTAVGILMTVLLPVLAVIGIILHITRRD